MTYLVMECRLSYAVVLDEAGRFLNVANLHYQVGQRVKEVTVLGPAEQETGEVTQPSGKKKNRWRYALTAAAACMVLAAASLFQLNQAPYASVYMTINPEVRIDVNRRDMVVGLEGVNQDGADLIRGYTYEKKELDLVMDELVDRAVDMDYLHEGGKITLNLDAEDGRWVVEKSDSLTVHLQKHLAETISVTIQVENPERLPLTSVAVSLDPGDGDTAYGELVSGGVLCLKVNPEIAISYDDQGLVTGVTARNDDAKAILDGYTEVSSAPLQRRHRLHPPGEKGEGQRPVRQVQRPPLCPGGGTHPGRG